MPGNKATSLWPHSVGQGMSQPRVNRRDTDLLPDGGAHPGSQMEGAPRIPDGGSTQDPRWEEYTESQMGGALKFPDKRSI